MSALISQRKHITLTDTTIAKSHISSIKLNFQLKFYCVNTSKERPFKIQHTAKEWESKQTRIKYLKWKKWHKIEIHSWNPMPGSHKEGNEA